MIQSAGVHGIETCCAVSNSKLLQKYAYLEHLRIFGGVGDVLL
jgi:hypothetical protein